MSVGRLTGTETYTFQLLKALAELGVSDPMRVYLNADRPPANPLPGEPCCIPFPRLWTHVRLSAEIVQHRPSVLFVPAHVVPLVHPRSVVTIHDLGYLHVPEAHPPRQRRLLDLTTRWSVHAAQRVIAISELTARDLREHYRVPDSKIVVVHHGISDIFGPVASDEIESIRTHFDLPLRYVLAVGTIQPRKNYGRLARAVAALNRRGNALTLVIAGKRGWLADQVQRDIAESGIGDRVRVLDYVEDRALPSLYAGAAVFCQPSLYEGFGLPVVEAMACGAPVVASNNSSLPEVAGDAALLVDPLDSDALASGIARVLEDSVLHAELVDRGRIRSASFTWQSCAEKTLRVLRTVREG